MPSYTPRLGLRYPVSSDPANPPSDFQLLATGIDNTSVVYYSSVSTSQPSGPTNGCIWFQTDTRDFYLWTGTAWRPINVHQSTSASPPVTGTGYWTGQLWYQTDNNQLFVHNGTTFVPASSATISATTPGTRAAGGLWYDTTNKGLKVNNAGTWESAQQVNPYLLCYKSANQTIGSTNTYTTITFGTTANSFGANAPTNSSGTITINQTGLYHIDFAANTVLATSPYLSSQIVTTSTAGNQTYHGNYNTNGGSFSGTSTNITIPFSAGDSFVCQVAAGSASTQLQGCQGTVYCTVAYIGPTS